MQSSEVNKANLQWYISFQCDELSVRSIARINPVPVLFFSVSHLEVYPLSLEHLLSTVNNSFMQSANHCGCNQVRIKNSIIRDPAAWS